MGVLKNLPVECAKNSKIKKVTTSRDDKGEGGDFYQEPSDRMARKKQQVPPLRYPGFPVEVWWRWRASCGFL